MIDDKTEVVTQKKTQIRMIDLCAGLGGFHRGAELAELALNEAGEGPWHFECVLAAELDLSLRSLYLDNFPALRPTYRSNFPVNRVQKLVKSLRSPELQDAAGIYGADDELIQVHGDIEALINDDQTGLRLWPDASGPNDFVVPEHDLLCAGFPCQPFSKSGSQLGFSDMRGTVFHLITMILEERRPSLVLLENVGNFERHDGGHTWRTVKETLSLLNYEWVATEHVTSDSQATGLLSPHHLGLPHHRERFFIVAQQRGIEWLPRLHDRVPFPQRPKTVDEQKKADLKAAKELSRIVTEAWKGESPEALHRAQIPSDRVKVINHWNLLLEMLAEDDARGNEPKWRTSMPSFPIWGYELDPFHWYPPYTNPRDLVDKPSELSKLRAKIIDETASRLESETNSTVDLLKHGPGRDRAFLSDQNLSNKSVLAWANSWPAYASKREKWPNWKQRFIQQNREWAIRMWSRLDPLALRGWLDDLFEQIPAASNQKLEWNCKGDELELWSHVLQFRPSGLRVKRFQHIPALVAMTTTQIPVVPILSKDEPNEGRVIGAAGRHLLRSEALQLQGFPPTWSNPSGREEAFRAFGNAVNCELVSEIFQCWLGSGGTLRSQATIDFGT
ncbi:MAG: hypothetical protein CMM12_01710 [Rhodospirillaceae bacterium]|nr:hypothetical protein [Rhodospirillaceae bacterium]